MNQNLELSQNAAKYGIIALDDELRARRSDRQKNGFSRFKSRRGWKQALNPASPQMLRSSGTDSQ